MSQLQQPARLRWGLYFFTRGDGATRHIQLIIHIVNEELISALEARGIACFDCTMSTVLIEIRRAKPHDAGAVADAHDEAWRTAYQGIIPGTELDRLINRRGPAWWD